MLILIISLLTLVDFASARNDCLCGICTAVAADGPSECNNPGGSCSIPSCGSYGSCQMTCGGNTPCNTYPGFCSVNSYQMWSYGPISRCYSFSSDVTGNVVCTINVQTSCFGVQEGQQTNEKLRLVVNGATIGLTDDNLCNNQAPPACFEDGPLTRTFSNVVIPVSQGSANTVRLETVQDSINLAGFTMTCTPQQAGPTCGNNVVEQGEQCEQNSQCNDNNPLTTDTCSSCQCRHDTVPNNFCGDGVINNNEQCEPPNANNNGACTQSTQTCQGTKTGVRDAYGYCNYACGCAQDTFAYACVQGSCGATCDSHSDCNDGDPGTRDTCNSNCGCTYEEVPYCGNARLDSNEQCESSSDCSPGKVCSGCMCVNGPYCGDANTDAGEQCDFGSAVNGIPCVAPTNGSCQYCRSDCSFATLTGGGCGNYKIEYNEQCDEGANNGVQCSPDSCNDFCVYCNNQCQIGHVNGPVCETNEIIPISQQPYYPSYYEYGYASYSGSGGAGICGDGVVSINEECDNGYDNGIACTAACNGDCNYCTSNCEEVLVEGPPCARKARPWDPVEIEPCRMVAYPVTFARLDENCLGNSKVVTSEVNASDNSRARQAACAIDPSSIYMSWENVQYSRGLKNLTLKLEHFEENSDIRIEYFDGSSWMTQCNIQRSQRDYVDSCRLASLPNPENIELRARVLRGGSNSYANIDHAYIVAEYCQGSSSCGNRVVDLGENCDDGNLISGDGCDEYCSRETLLCAEWGECIDGQETQICYYGNFIRSNTRNCGPVFFAENALSIWLLFLLIIIVMLFLFFPTVYMGLKKRRK
jgi:cysteine-rich repeat protein